MWVFPPCTLCVRHVCLLPAEVRGYQISWEFWEWNPQSFARATNVLSAEPVL